MRCVAPDGAAWNPWRALRQRPDTAFAFAALGGPAGRWERDPDGDVILIEATLGRRARRVALAHELVHAERGVGHPDASGATMSLEEERVRREVARRLVPSAALRRFVAARAGVGPVEPDDVAEEFDVTPEVADLACRLLAGAGGGWAGEP